MTRTAKRTRRRCEYCGETYKPPRHGRWTNHKCPQESAAQVRRINEEAVEAAKRLGDQRRIDRAVRARDWWDEKLRSEGR